MRILFISIIIVLLSISNVFSQSKKQLVRKKRKAEKELNYVSKLLKKTRKTKEVSYNQLLLIKQKMKLRQEIINNIAAQVALLKQQIQDNNKVIEALESDLVKIKEDYAKTIVFAYKHRNKNDFLLFIFSAETFNQSYKRLKYIQQYTQYQKKQAERIKTTQKVLVERIQKMEEQKIEEEKLLALHQEETNLLLSEKQERENVLSSLQSKEASLKKKLAAYQRKVQQIQNAITAYIRREAKKNRSKNKKSSFDALTPEQKLISTKFGENKGRLPWPVKRGVITYNFGLHQHPVLKEVTEKKNGIGITTTEGSFARSIFDGTVTNILPLSTNNYAIIVKHGEYLTVYVNIKEIMVSVGQKVKAKQELGVIFTKDHKTVLELQVWKGAKLQNPKYWITKK